MTFAAAIVRWAADLVELIGVVINFVGIDIFAATAGSEIMKDSFYAAAFATNSIFPTLAWF